MDAVEILSNKLAEYQFIPISIDGSTATVKAVSPIGFDITLIDERNEAIVFYEGWHAHFNSKEEAVNCFLFGLSSKCRVRVDRRGGKAYRWTLESYENSNWVSYNTISLLFFPFWKQRDIIYLQNAHIN